MPPAPLNFPISPSVADKWPSPPVPSQPVYTWDGVKWTTLDNAINDVTGPTSTLPKMDGVAAVGTEINWAHGDHVHPSDTGKIAGTGGTMTGDLTISKADPQVTLDKTGGSSLITGKKAGLSRWTLALGDNTAESGSNSGSDLALSFLNDAGSTSGTALIGKRSDGLLTVKSDPIADLGIATKQYVDAIASPLPLSEGVQVNGAMEVSQQNGTTLVTNATSYVLDCWRVAKAGPSVVSGAQSLGFASILTGFNYAAVLNTTTAETSPAAGSYVTFEQPIEGWRIARLLWGNNGARPVTIGFWSAHTVQGVYTVSVRNAASTRSYCATYTQVVSVSPQYNSIVIPGCIDGVWETGFNAGMIVSFTQASGTTFTAPSANAWLTGNYFAAPGQVNGVGATNRQLMITGVTVLPGAEGINADRSPLIMRQFDQELLACKRYWQSVYTGGFRMYVQNIVRLPIPFAVEMRATPALTKTSPALGVQADNTTATAVFLYIDLQFTGAGNGVIDGGYNVIANARF